MNDHWWHSSETRSIRCCSARSNLTYGINHRNMQMRAGKAEAVQQRGARHGVEAAASTPNGARRVNGVATGGGGAAAATVQQTRAVCTIGHQRHCVWRRRRVLEAGIDSRVLPVCPVQHAASRAAVQEVQRGSSYLHSRRRQPLAVGSVPRITAE